MKMLMNEIAVEGSDCYSISKNNIFTKRLDKWLLLGTKNEL